MKATFLVHIETADLEALKTMADAESKESGERVTVSELIRRGIRLIVSPSLEDR